MYRIKLTAILEPDLMINCKETIEELKERRHKIVLERQTSKFERLKLKMHLKSRAAIAAKITSKVTTQTRSRHYLCQTNVGPSIYQKPPYLTYRKHY